MRKIITTVKLLTLLIVASTMGIFFGHILRTNALLKTAVIRQEAKASVLVQEIGATKEENQRLFQQMNRMNETLKLVGTMPDATPIIVAPAVDKAPAVSAASTAKVKVRRSENSSEISIPELPETIVNFLIIGHHSRLADSIMVATANPERNTVTLTSLPRDLSVNGRKINEYLSLYGIEVLAEKVSAVTGLSIDQYIVFDFAAFEKVIDALDGVDIDVKKTIVDYTYPGAHGSYQYYIVEKGMHHMTGADALKYSRSRHSSSDFDRMRRQQEVVSAVRQEVRELSGLDMLALLHSLYDTLEDEIETDLGITDIIRYATAFRDFGIEHAQIFSTGNFLYSTHSISGQYILLPVGGSFGQMQKHIAEKIRGDI